MAERRARVWMLPITLACTAASAQAPYEGRWTIVRGEPAPWVEGKHAIDAGEVKRLVGRHVTFEAGRIRAPSPLDCGHPHYALKHVPAEGVFQGGLAEYGDHAVDADTLATRIGFTTRPIATLDTGCDGPLEFHATGDDELLFALDNVVYRLHRDVTQPPPPRKP